MIRTQDDESDFAVGQVLLMNDIAISGYQDVESLLLSRGKESAIRKASPTHLWNGTDRMARQLVADADGNTLIQQQAHASLV